MARERWTLALILICLPILATVITAFRVRDLPKSYDSVKLETKKTQQCDNCDVKNEQKVNSAKIESDTSKYGELKSDVRENQRMIAEKGLSGLSKHKYNVKSDKNDDIQDELEFPEVSTGFRKEYPKDSKQVKIKMDLKNKLNNKKNNFELYITNSDSSDDESEVGDDDNDGEDDDNVKTQTKLKRKLPDLKKASPVKPKLGNTILHTKVVSKKYISDSHEDEDDDSDKEIENISYIKKKESSKPELGELDDDDDDEEDDDSYDGLDYIDELFKILDMSPGKKSKTTVEKNHKRTPNKEVNIKSGKMSKVSIEGDDSEDDDEDDDNESDDGNANDHIAKDIKIDKKIQPKITVPIISLAPSQIIEESHIKIPSVKDGKRVEMPEKKAQAHSNTENEKNKNEASPQKLDSKDQNLNSKQEKNLKSKSSFETTTHESLKKGDKPLDTTKKDKVSVQNAKKEIIDDKNQSKVLNNKDNNKERKDSKNNDIKLHVNTDPTKKTKETEKEPIRHGGQKINDESNSREKVEKVPMKQPKKEQTEHRDIFNIPERKKDIKYDFEKPNAHKDRRTFDYSEFEKMQVLKSHHKEKKKEKISGESTSDSREEQYLKHVTEALNRRNLLKSEFEDFYAFFPTFAPNFSRIHNPECRRHGQILLRQLRGTKLWALNILDATAKIPSGILQGNGIQLGDFDQCLGSRARVQLDTGNVVKVQGKYCLARIDLKAEHTELEAPVYLAQAKSLIRSRIDDPGHFVPRFSTLSWGVCVPSACDREDVEIFVKDAIKHYQHKSGFIVKVKVDEDDCHTDEGFDWEDWLELPTVLTLSFYGVVILLVLLATTQDFIARKQPEEDQEKTEQQAKCNQKEKEDEEKKQDTQQQSDAFLSPFSLYRSFDKLTASGSTDEITCIHGVRGIATLALLVAHKFMPVASMPYTNRLRITEMASSPFWSWCRAGWVFTDCFLLLSGTLTSHRIASNENTGAVWRLFSRYLRLTPALLAVVLFYAYIWDKLSTGPMWGTFVTKNAEACEKGWWWNLLYVQNYFGMEDMCAPQTHQLALDMQLTIIGGIIIWALQSNILFARLILPALHLLAGYMRYTTVKEHRLTMLAYHGVSVSQLYRSARLSYTSALHRCSPYLIGLSLGLALKTPAKHGKFLLTLGWLTSIGLGALVVWSGIDSGSTQYRYNASFAAQYATIAPIASAMAIAWIIYAVHSGTCEILSSLLCWRPLVIISRLSYGLYLCQFIIFITNIGTVRTSKEFTLMSLFDVQEISAILLSSTILTLTFVIPMQSLHKNFIFEWKSKPEKSAEKDIVESEQKSKEENVEQTKEQTPPIRSRHHLVAHREVLEEIPEVEVEYESQRENTEGLDEIMEEDEGTIGEDEDINDLEIIEEEEAGEEEEWIERDGERSYSRGEDRDIDEWEWTANGNRSSGAQYYRYSR